MKTHLAFITGLLLVAACASASPTGSTVLQDIASAAPTDAASASAIPVTASGACEARDLEEQAHTLYGPLLDVVNDLHDSRSLIAVGAYVNQAKFVGQLAGDLCGGQDVGPNPNICHNVQAAEGLSALRRNKAQLVIPDAALQSPSFGDVAAAASALRQVDQLSGVAAIKLVGIFC